MSDHLSRRTFLRTAALGSAGLVLASKVNAQPVRLHRKPNLIVFLPDQQRPDTIACYGGNPVLAPNLNKLASQSSVFHNAYATHPVCTPSRSSLMTGTWPHINGCQENGMRLQPSFRCLPEMIDDEDYIYAYMGKWHLGDEVFAQHGFTEWVSILDGFGVNGGENHHRPLICDYDRFLLSKDLEPDNSKGTFTPGFASRLPLEFSKPKFLEMKACEFLDQHRRDPFILFVSFYEPHPPYNGPLNNEHPLDQVHLDRTADHTFGAEMPLRYRLRQEWDQEQYGASPEKYLKLKQKYLGLVTEVDQSVGAILMKLEKLGLVDNTIVIHTSDHGDMMSAHRMFGKEVCFEEALRVPYLVRMPDQRRSISVSQSISHIDFAPTILELLGKPPHEQCAGQSRAALLRGEAMTPETIFAEWSPNVVPKVKQHTRLATRSEIQQAINESTRTAISPDGWKLCLRDTDKNELYNLQSDPGERQNLYGRLELKALRRQLTGEIHRWQERTKDSIKV